MYTLKHPLWFFYPKADFHKAMSANGIFKEESPGFKRPQGSTKLKADSLDPIPESIVGKVDVEEIIKQIKGTMTEKWVVILSRCIQKNVPSETFCGRLDRNRQRPPPKSRMETRKAVNILARSILEAAESPGDPTTSLFMVAKGEDKSRAIGNCKEVNEMFAPPPDLVFATVDDIFRIVTFFKGESFFATGDFRHWFYQISLPELARRFFTVEGENNETYQFKVWPMGFSWSPFVAQGLSMLLARISVENVTGLSVESPLRDADKLPPFWIVKRAGVTVAFIVFWYDNFLVSTGEEELRNAILKELRAVTKRFKATWKHNGQGMEEGGLAMEGKEFTLSQDAVEYLGIESVKRMWEGSEQWQWRHVEKNRTKWRKLVQDALKSLDTQGTWRLLAGLLGVLTWHWIVKGDDRRSMERCFEISRKVGENVKFSDEAWDWLATVDKVERAEWNFICNRIKEVIKDGVWHQHHFKELETNFEHRYYVASDAMGKAWAGVDLVNPEGVPIYAQFSEEQIEEVHINWKEAYAAILTLKWGLSKCRENSLVCIAVDNVTAVAIVNKKAAPLYKDLDAALVKLEAQYRERRCGWRAFKVAGKNQPADEPSRNTKVNVEKARECKKDMTERELSAWDGLYNEQRAGNSQREVAQETPTVSRNRNRRDKRERE